MSGGSPKYIAEILFDGISWIARYRESKCWNYIFGAKHGKTSILIAYYAIFLSSSIFLGNFFLFHQLLVDCFIEPQCCVPQELVIAYRWVYFGFANQNRSCLISKAIF